MKPQFTKYDLENRFVDYIRSLKLVGSGERVLMAVSGGADSVVMLELFCRIRERYGLQLAVAHVHHDLRGRDADEDETFVLELARRSGLAVFTFRTQVGKIARNHKCSIEEAGRTVRFGFFQTVLSRTQFDCVALAHHADDRAETILMHLFRGSGLRGLAGIVPRRGNVIHPMLFATRREIMDWTEITGLNYRDDKSNHEPVYLRNRIRLNLMPEIKRIYEDKVVTRICNAGNAAVEAEENLASQIEEAVSDGVLFHKNHEFILDIREFLKYFTYRQTGLLMYIIRQLRPGNTFVRRSEIERLMELILSRKSGSRRFDAKSFSVTVSGSRAVFRSGKVETPVPTEIPFDKWVVIPELKGRIRICRLHASGPIKFRKPSEWSEIIDGEHIKHAFNLRTRKQGDRFHPLGMPVPKKLNHFFIDEKVPVSERSRIPILEYENEIVWVVGYRIAHPFRVKPYSVNVVQLLWQPE
ncbi:tRNA lysidine(34) synthetase TilS [bacterium]|nr:tRNA lysidine(34) synthetase TilS [bacterium]